VRPSDKNHQQLKSCGGQAFELAWPYLIYNAIPYLAAKKTRSFGGAACAISCQVEILSLVRNTTGFTHFITAYQA
jgi:hypothetical protein